MVTGELTKLMPPPAAFADAGEWFTWTASGLSTTDGAGLSSAGSWLASRRARHQSRSSARRSRAPTTPERSRQSCSHDHSAGNAFVSALPLRASNTPRTTATGPSHVIVRPRLGLPPMNRS